jgi:hypothetical protein
MTRSAPPPISQSWTIATLGCLSACWLLAVDELFISLSLFFLCGPGPSFEDPGFIPNIVPESEEAGSNKLADLRLNSDISQIA